MADPPRLHSSVTRVLSLAMIAIGIALIVRTIALGGSGAAIGVVLGVLFVAAGGARLYLQARQGRGS
jgi:hypothetical protein